MVGLFHILWDLSVESMHADLHNTFKGAFSSLCGAKPTHTSPWVTMTSMDSGIHLILRLLNPNTFEKLESKRPEVAEKLLFLPSA